MALTSEHSQELLNKAMGITPQPETETIDDEIIDEGPTKEEKRLARRAELLNNVLIPVEENVPQTLSDSLDPETDGFAMDQWKIGIVQTIQMLMDAPHDPSRAIIMKGLDLVGFGNEERQQKVNEAAEEFLGVQGIQPSNAWDKVMAPAYRAAGDPLSLLGMGGSTVVRKGVTGLAEFLHSIAASIAGDQGAQLLPEIVRGFGGDPESETGQEAIRFMGGLLGGAFTGVARTPISYGISKGADIYTQRNAINKKGAEAVDYLASSQIQRTVEEARVAQPNMEDVITSVHDLENAVPGLVLPPMATLADNPIYRKNTETLLRTRPDFYAQAKASLADAGEALESYKTRAYGVGGAEADALIRANLPKDYGLNIKKAQVKIDELDVDITRQTERLDTRGDIEEVGNQVKSIMTAKSKAVEDNLRPQYEAALLKAENKGVVVAPEDVVALRKSINAQYKRGIFDEFPTLYQKIQNTWSKERVAPKAAQDYSLIQDVGGGAFRKSGPQAAEGLPVRELDSLKRAVNRAIRETKNPEKRRFLGFLKDKVSDIYKKTGELGETIADLDGQFYEKLGVPRSQAGIRQLDSARFSTQAGGYLSKPEQAREFLAFVGEEGIPVVRDSIMIRARNSLVDMDGHVRVKALTKFMKNNDTLINMVPGLKDEFLDISTTLTKMDTTKARIEADYTQYAKEQADGFYKAFNEGSLSSVVDSILARPERSSQFFKDMQNFTPDTAKMVKRAVRAEILEKGMAGGMSMDQFLSQNRQAVDQWFGKNYASHVKRIGEISDILSNFNVKDMSFAIDFSKTDTLEKATGVSFPQLQSVLRDRISSGTTKLAILFSKVTSSKVANKTDEALMQLLLDPRSVDHLVDIGNKHNISMTHLPKAALQEFGEMGAFYVGKGGYVGTTNNDELEAEGVTVPAPPRPSYDHTMPMVR